MTREEVKKAADIMLAFADGVEIQYSHKGQNNWLNWINESSPSFDWQTFDYRIKSEPKYRPFKTQEECWDEMHKHPDFGWVKRMEEPAYLSLNKIEEIGRVDGWDFSDIFKHITFTDGEPFGVKEE